VADQRFFQALIGVRRHRNHFCPVLARLPQPRENIVRMLRRRRDHDPVAGMTLYGADIMVSPDHQRHGLAHALTDATRALVMAEHLWRMVGASRLPGYGKVADRMSAAVNNLSERKEFTRRYQELTAHYGLTMEKINPRQAHENGDAEQSHHQFKRAERPHSIIL